MKGENKSVVYTLKLGSLYLDDKPVTLGAGYRPGQAISFGATTSNEPISWVPVNGLLIADRCLLASINWDDLDAQNLVFGKEVKIQGFQFRSRLLKVGNAEGVPNEWDAALDVAGENDDLWHWEDMFFWGQEIPVTAVSSRAGRGYGSARCWDWNHTSSRGVIIGFRPVLEPLPPDLSALRQGKKILVVGRDGCVMGKLVEKTQYDLVLQPESDGLVGKAAFAANMRDGTVAIDRSGILGLSAT